MQIWWEYCGLWFNGEQFQIVSSWCLKLAPCGVTHFITELHNPSWTDMVCSWDHYMTRARAWWRHQMETFAALLAICAGNSPVPGEFLAQRPMTRSFDVFFDLRLNKRLSKQSWGWWFETISRPLWHHRNGNFRTVASGHCIANLFDHDAVGSFLVW